MVSALNGPIPPHPDFETSAAIRSPQTGSPQTSQTIPSPGVSDAISMVLQIEGQRVGSAASRRPNSAPKDHVAENVRRMRRIQNESRKKQAGSSEPVKALWKSSKYEGVQSRVKEDLSKEPPPVRPQSASYLRAHSRTGTGTPHAPRSRPASAGAKPVEPQVSVPKADTAKDVQLIRRDLNFLKVNGMNAKHSAMKRCPSLTALDDLKKKQEEETKNYKRGSVPKYLTQRQRQWKQDEEERIRNIPDPDLPDGHKVMPDEERRAMLSKLQTSQSEILQQMSCMPVRTDTLKIRTQKEELEKKLTEVEEAIKIFSRLKVFVKLDS